METTVAIAGGIGFFLLGMAVMTDGLKALAGSALRAVLAKAAATSLSGTIWGAVITLLVQSSSATTMTTIGLVSAGLLTFPQGLSLVFGANIGTTGTGWLVALLGVRVSLTAYALPMVFAGALLKLVGKGRWAASGASIAGFALILVGLTTLQQGMGGLGRTVANPADLPAVPGGPAWWSGARARGPCRDRHRDDHRDAIRPLRSRSPSRRLCWRHRAHRPGAGHRPEHRHVDELGDGGGRSQQHAAAGRGLHRLRGSPPSSSLLFP